MSEPSDVPTGCSRMAIANDKGTRRAYVFARADHMGTSQKQGGTVVSN